MLALFLTIHNISGKMYVELRTTFSTATRAYKHTSNQLDIMYLQYFKFSPKRMQPPTGVNGSYQEGKQSIQDISTTCSSDGTDL